MTANTGRAACGSRASQGHSLSHDCSDTFFTCDCDTCPCVSVLSVTRVNEYGVGTFHQFIPAASSTSPAVEVTCRHASTTAQRPPLSGAHRGRKGKVAYFAGRQHLHVRARASKNRGKKEHMERWVATVRSIIGGCRHECVGKGGGERERERERERESLHSAPQPAHARARHRAARARHGHTDLHDDDRRAKRGRTLPDPPMDASTSMLSRPNPPAPSMGSPGCTRAWA